MVRRKCVNLSILPRRSTHMFFSDFDPAAVDPVDFTPLFDEGELTHKVK